MLASALSLLLLHGCPDPQTASSIGHGPGGAAQPGAPGPGPTPQATTGVPPTPGAFEVSEGEGVQVSGTFAYAGSATGDLRIDFLQKEGDAPPRLLHSLELDAPGPWSVEAPKGTGSVTIVAFVDLEKDGPSSDDPGGIVSEPVVIDASPITDVLITVSDNPDLGEFTPGGHHFDPATVPNAPGTEAAPADATAAEDAPTEAPTDAPAEPADVPADAPAEDPAPDTPAAPTPPVEATPAEGTPVAPTDTGSAATE